MSRKTEAGFRLRRWTGRRKRRSTQWTRKAWQPRSFRLRYLASGSATLTLHAARRGSVTTTRPILLVVTRDGSDCFRSCRCRTLRAVCARSNTGSTFSKRVESVSSRTTATSLGRNGWAIRPLPPCSKNLTGARLWCLCIRSLRIAARSCSPTSRRWCRKFHKTHHARRHQPTFYRHIQPLPRHSLYLLARRRRCANGHGSPTRLCAQEQR